MARYIREMKIPRAQQLNGRSLVQRVMFLAHESCILDRFVTDILDVCSRTDDPHIVWQSQQLTVSACIRFYLHVGHIPWWGCSVFSAMSGGIEKN
jgi:hypothetical protein